MRLKKDAVVWAIGYPCDKHDYSLKASNTQTRVELSLGSSSRPLKFYINRVSTTGIINPSQRLTEKVYTYTRKILLCIYFYLYFY